MEYEGLLENCLGSQVKVRILKHDYLILFIDFDIFCKHHYMKDPAPGKQSKHVRASFHKKMKQVFKKAKKRDLTVLLAPSFLCIEYAIALGCLQFDIPVESIGCCREDIFSVFDVTLKRKVSRAKKNFLEIIGDNSKFSIVQMIEYSRYIRSIHSFPLNAEDLWNLIKDLGEFEGIVEQEIIPFTYVDVLHSTLSKVKALSIE